MCRLFGLHAGAPVDAEFWLIDGAGQPVGAEPPQPRRCRDRGAGAGRRPAAARRGSCAVAGPLASARSPVRRLAAADWPAAAASGAAGGGSSLDVRCAVTCRARWPTAAADLTFP